MKYFLPLALLILTSCQLAELKLRDNDVHPMVAERVEVTEPKAAMVQIESAPLTLSSNCNIYPGAATGTLEVKTNAIHGEKGMVSIPIRLTVSTARGTVYCPVNLDFSKVAEVLDKVAQRVHDDAVAEGIKIHDDVRLLVGGLILLFGVYVYLKERKR
jgi:hypothetical protein